MNTQIDSTALFEKIKDECPKKKVVSLCNKLIKKLSFGNSSDVENLCDLCYWLYVYERADLSLSCVNLTRGLIFDQNFNVWGEIHAMWGLGIRILRAQDKHQEAKAIAAQIDIHLLQPSRINTPPGQPRRFHTPESQLKNETARRKRFVIGKENDQGTGFIEVSYQSKIENALNDDDTNSANSWRLGALSRLIGNTETGLYPFLNEHQERIEKTIAEYIAELQKVK